MSRLQRHRLSPKLSFLVGAEGWLRGWGKWVGCVGWVGWMGWVGRVGVGGLVGMGLVVVMAVMVMGGERD